MVPLIQPDWEVASGSWDDILSNVIEVRIFPDYFDHSGQVTGVDNTLLIVATPGVGLCCAASRPGPDETTEKP